MVSVTKKRFEALDAFRGLCALSVVMFHMHLVGSITELDFFRGGFVFVEFFFVLSGFVLAHGYGFKGDLSFKIFMKARFFRLYPLHLFMFFVFILLECGKLVAYEYGGFIFNNEPFTNSFAVREMIPNLLLIHSWTPLTDPLSFNAPSWSISIEFYVYALFFVSIVTFKKYKTVSWLVLSMMAFILMYLGSELLVNKVLRGMSCFFGGAFVYVIYTKVSDVKPPFILGSLVEAVLLTGIFLAVKSQFDYSSIIIPVIFVITVLFFAFESGCFSLLFKIKPLQYTGKLSYSIYMTHVAILFCLVSFGMVLQKISGHEIAPMIDAQRYLNFGGGLVNNVVVLLVISVVVYISSLTYKYVELWGQGMNKK